MNWYIIFANDNKINDLLLYFNNHPEMTAFVPKIEKLMKTQHINIKHSLSIYLGCN